jgi:hypothetical protein
MTNQRRSLPALEKLKEQHTRRINNFHNPKIKDIVGVARSISLEEASEIIKDVEAYALKKYPQLSKLLKCETGHSQAVNGRVEIGFKFTSSKVGKERERIETIKRSRSSDMAALEEWYMRFLASCAGGQDLPAFVPKHLEGVSMEYTYCNDSDLTI